MRLFPGATATGRRKETDSYQMEYIYIERERER